MPDFTGQPCTRLLHSLRLKGVYNFGAVEKKSRYTKPLYQYYMASDIDLSIFHKIENADLADHINRVGKECYAFCHSARFMR